MGLLSKIFGQSELEEEFNRCAGLEWMLVIQNIRRVEKQVGDNTIVSNYSPSTLLFNFQTKELLMQGDIVNKVFLGEDHFQIVRLNIMAEQPEFYLASMSNINKIIMKCKVARKHLYFEKTLENWRCKLINENKWIISTTNKNNII